MRRAKTNIELSKSYLVAGRADLAYVHASEAAQLDGANHAAALLCRHALYQLMPNKRCIDNATKLCEQAEELKAKGQRNEAYNLFYGAHRWHPSVRTLYGLMHACDSLLPNNLTVYMLASELLALCSPERKHLMAEATQLSCLESWQFPHVNAEDFQVFVRALPNSYHPSTWPTNVGVGLLVLTPLQECARVLKREDGCELLPPVPFSQLVDFLNDHVGGSVDEWAFNSADEAHAEAVFIRLIREVNPERFRRSRCIQFALFFENMPWRDVRHAFDEVLVGVKSFIFNDLKLPRGIEPDELFSLRAIRQCQSLELWPLVDNHVLAGAYGPYAKFSAEAIIGWLNATGCRMKLRCEHVISCNFGGDFIEGVEENFLNAKEPSSAALLFYYPDVGMDQIARQHNEHYEPAIRDRTLVNSIGEQMTMRVGVALDKTYPLGETASATFNVFKTVTVHRRMVEKGDGE